MTHNLLLNYGLYKQMKIYRPRHATKQEMSQFHSEDYVKFLRLITPDNMNEYTKQLQRCTRAYFPLSSSGEICCGQSSLGTLSDD